MEPHPLARRRLIVLREAEYDKASYEAPDLVNEAETWVVNYDQAVETLADSLVLSRLAQQRLLRPDELYLLSPYDDSYVLAADAEELFSLRKFEIFTSLCSLLGATRVVAQRVDIETSTEHQQVDLTVARGPVTAKANASRDLRESMARRFSLTTSFEAGEPRLEQAAELLNCHGLSEDSTMRGLLDLFRQGGSRVTSQEVVLKLTSEASRELKAAASLKIPAVLAISASFKDLRVNIQEILVELQVTF